MAALFQGTNPNPVPGDSGPAARTADPPSVTAGLAYVSRCLRGHRPFGVITGSTQALEALLERAAADCTANEELHVVRISTPTDSVQAFLTTCLGQLGFELFNAGLDDFHNLLVVFLRHESARGRRTVALIEATEHCGPRVLEFMQTLAKVRAGATPAITFMLTGSPALHRVLDSPGMAELRAFTRERFDLDRSLAWVAVEGKARTVVGPWSRSSGTPRSEPLVQDPGSRSLVVMLDGAIVSSLGLTPGRLVIGRSPNTGLCLSSRYVSRHHAVLVVSPDSATVVDLRSTNGTLVNGKAATSQQLEHGDLLTIGNFRLRYYSGVRRGSNRPS